ncbi:MAG: TetR family transcriptional regulator [Rhizobiaceae bacterium]|nr:TetR family transcriptional regulator [Rhizobiaceae bacterium]
MDSESKAVRNQTRRLQILRATLRLLRRHGSAITTAQIAAEAHCSKETLYNWFGDRDGIMMALAHEQASGMRQAMADRFAAAQGSLEARLGSCATLLLDIMTGDAALAINRVAMAQACSENADLGLAVMADWKDQVAKPFLDLFQEGNESGELAVHSPMEAFENLIGLLVGDRQRQLLLGEDVRPEPATMKAVATKAVQRWMILYRR